MENCTLDRYKLAWMQNGLMHSTMHPTLAAARGHERTVPGPHMLMELHTHSGTAYTWKLLPGPWADAVRHWQWLALAVAALVVYLATAK